MTGITKNRPGIIQVLLVMIVLVNAVILPMFKRDIYFSFLNKQLFSLVNLIDSFLILVVFLFASYNIIKTKKINLHFSSKILLVFAGLAVLHLVLGMISVKEVIGGLRSYIKFPFLFFCLMNLDLGLDFYRKVIKIFLWILYISIPLSIIQFSVFKWYWDYCGGILPAGPVAVIGAVIFIYQMHLLLMSKDLKGLLILTGLLCIFITAETKWSLILLGISSIAFLFYYRKQLLFWAASLFMVIMLLLLIFVFGQGRIIIRMTSPEVVNDYLFQDDKSSERIVDYNRERLYKIYQEKGEYRLKRISALLFSIKEISSSWKDLVIGKGIGSVTPFMNNKNFYIGLHLYHTQINKLMLEAGLSGLLIFLWLLYKLFRESTGIKSQKENRMDNAFIKTMPYLVLFYGLSIIYIEIFQDPANNAFFWFSLAYFSGMKN